MENESALRLWETFSTNKPNVPETCNGVWTLGDSEEYTKWGNVLILSGLKTVFSYPGDALRMEGKPIPEPGNHYVLLDSQEQGIAVIQTQDIKVYPFEEVPESYAEKAGEGDRTIETWRENHKPFFKRVLEEKEIEFTTKAAILCVEFELVFAA